tara:strand:+ start:4842 stop:5042 length:201 start_codon:yes stop_codon:yes gene_type:complete
MRKIVIYLRQNRKSIIGRIIRKNLLGTKNIKKKERVILGFVMIAIKYMLGQLKRLTLNLKNILTMC